jgi:hypothetical protein
MSTDVKITPETFIDRSQERTIFRSMFAADTDAGLRVMQISVPSGGGKSGLLKIFFEFCRLGEVEARPVLVDFKIMGDSVIALDVAVLVQETLERGAPKAFERFAKIHDDYRVERRQSFFPVTTPRSITVNQTGSDLKNTTMTAVTLTNEVSPFTPAEHAVAQAKCLQVFGEELQELLASTDVLVIVDHWEQAPPEVKEWLRGQLVRDGIATIEGGPAHARLRVVVAGQPLNERQPSGLDQHEFLDWFPRPVEYKATVSVHESLSSFADEDVKSFMELYGMSEKHPDFPTVFPNVRLLAGRGNLETARQLVQALTAGGNP